MPQLTIEQLNVQNMDILSRDDEDECENECVNNKENIFPGHLCQQGQRLEAVRVLAQVPFTKQSDNTKSRAPLRDITHQYGIARKIKAKENNYDLSSVNNNDNIFVHLILKKIWGKCIQSIYIYINIEGGGD